MIEQKTRLWHVANLPVVPYRQAWDLQLSILNAKKRGTLTKDVLLLLEHTPVFTLGRRGGSDNLKVSQCLLEQSGIEVIQVERGGNITFHGPGQLVGYPIVDLRCNGLAVASYVEGLEEAMIRTAGEWFVPAQRNPLNRGVWVGNKKLGSIGIAIRRGISFHGFALNVNTSLKPYEWINPCGMENTQMTSIAHATENGMKVSMAQARSAMKHHMADVFDIQLTSLRRDKIDSEIFEVRLSE